MKTIIKFKNLFLLSAVTLGSNALAEGTITVLQVKGSKAIVKFEGEAPQARQTYDLSSHEGSSGGSAGSASREMYLNLDTDLFSKTLATGETVTMKVAGTPGWNFGAFEVGVPVALSFTGAPKGSMATTKFALGVDGQYNFVENHPGEKMIPFVHLTLGGDMSRGPVSSSGTTVAAITKDMSTAIGIGLQYFINNQVAVNGGFDLGMSKSLASGTKFVKTISVPVGIRAYF